MYVLGSHPHIYALYHDFWGYIIVGSIAIGSCGWRSWVCAGGVCEFYEGRGREVFVFEDDEFCAWRVVVEDGCGGVEGGGRLGLVQGEGGEGRGCRGVVEDFHC